MSRRPTVLLILGPTATGKTALALEVARLLDGEIISADSRQAYRGLEVGTAAPTPSERTSVPHHGVAFLEPGERYGAGRFARLCRQWVSEIESRGRVPIVAGGTGFFVRTLLQPVFREPDLDAERRSVLESLVSELPLEEVRRWARRLDPAMGVRLPAVDRQRAGRTRAVAYSGREHAVVSGHDLGQERSVGQIALLRGDPFIGQIGCRRLLVAYATAVPGLHLGIPGPAKHWPHDVLPTASTIICSK